MEHEHSDFQNRFSEIQTLAKYGHPIAQYELAMAFINEDGVSGCLAEAIKFLEKSANQHFVPACANLALFYANGSGKKQNLPMAIHYFADALRYAHPGELSNSFISEFCKQIDIDTLARLAKEGNAQAQCFLGICHADGIGVPKDISKAWDLYIQASEQDEALALYMLSTYYAEGKYVPRDLLHSEAIMTQAAASGSIMAQEHKPLIRESIVIKFRFYSSK